MAVNFNDVKKNSLEKSTNIIDPAIKKLSYKILTKFIEQSQRRFNFLLMGRTGVGKSSTINTLMSQNIAPVGDYEPTTFTVESFDAEAYGIPFRFIDTPGLCDDLPEKGNDRIYLSKIKNQIKYLDCMWFVSELHATRVTADEKRAIKLIHQAFGSDIWNYTIIVFTFSNFVKPEKFPEKFSKRTKLIREEIAKYAGEQVAKTVPCVAVDNHSQTNPDGQEWLYELYTILFKKMYEHKTLPLIQI